MAKRKQAADAWQQCTGPSTQLPIKVSPTLNSPQKRQKASRKSRAGHASRSSADWPDPHGRHMIDIGDGRKMRLFLNRKFNQNAIQFTAPEGENSKPAPEDIGFLKDHGFQWRNDERVWTKQLARNTDENRYARGDSDKEAEDEFVELANRIRARKGMQPVEYSFSEQRAGGRG